MSNDTSPYESPKAGYAGKSNHIIYEEPRALSLNQRLNRLRYSCYQLTLMVLVVLVSILGVLLYQAAGGQESMAAKIGGAIAALILGAAAMVYSLALIVRRLHDLGRSGWMGLWLLAPLAANLLVVFVANLTWLPVLAQCIQVGFLLYLLAGVSEHGMNGYGTPNPPNTMLVMVFGGLWWVFSVISLLLSLAFMVFALFAPQLLPADLLEQLNALGPLP